MKYKTEIIRVNLSNSFTTRTRCLKCGAEPTIYFYSFKPYLFEDHRHASSLIEYVRKRFKRVQLDWYLEARPKDFTGIVSFSHLVNYKGFNPKLFKSKGIDQDNNIVQFIACWSGCTVWAFSDKASENRREITQRRARYNHPTKYSF
jgi:hypothetical protein